MSVSVWRPGEKREENSTGPRGSSEQSRAALPLAHGPAPPPHSPLFAMPSMPSLSELSSFERHITWQKINYGLHIVQVNTGGEDREIKKKQRKKMIERKMGREKKEKKRICLQNSIRIPDGIKMGM